MSGKKKFLLAPKKPLVSKLMKKLKFLTTGNPKFGLGFLFLLILVSAFASSFWLSPISESVVFVKSAEVSWPEGGEGGDWVYLKFELLNQGSTSIWFVGRKSRVTNFAVYETDGVEVTGLICSSRMTPENWTELRPNCSVPFNSAIPLPTTLGRSAKTKNKKFILGFEISDWRGYKKFVQGMICFSPPNCTIERIAD